MHKPKDESVAEALYGPLVGTTEAGHELRERGGFRVEIAASGGNLGEQHLVMRTRQPGSERWSEWFVACNRLTWSRSHDNFCYSDMDESMAPPICSAPRSVLEAAERLAPLPTLSEDTRAQIDALQERLRGDYRALSREIRALDRHWSAREWRRQAWAELHRREAARDRMRALRDGARIRFRKPIQMRSGPYDTFQVLKDGRRWTLYLPERGVRCRVPGWKEMPFEIVG